MHIGAHPCPTSAGSSGCGEGSSERGGEGQGGGTQRNPPVVRVESIDTSSSEPDTPLRRSGKFEQGSLRQLRDATPTEKPKKPSLALAEAVDDDAETDTDGDSTLNDSARHLRLSSEPLHEDDETDTDMSISALEPTRYSYAKTSSGRTAFVNESLACLDQESAEEEDEAIAAAIRTDTPPPRDTPVPRLEPISEDGNLLAVSHMALDAQSLNSNFSMDGEAATYEGVYDGVYDGGYDGGYVEVQGAETFILGDDHRTLPCLPYCYLSLVGFCLGCLCDVYSRCPLSLYGDIAALDCNAVLFPNDFPHTVLHIVNNLVLTICTRFSLFLQSSTANA